MAETNPIPDGTSFDIITTAQMHEIEQEIAADAHGIARRAALAALTRPADELAAALAADDGKAQAFAEMAWALRGYAEHLAGVARLVATAEARVLAALSARSDADDLYARAADRVMH